MGACNICKVRELEILARIQGFNWVAEATKVTRKFSDIMGTIVQANSKTILPGKRFDVKVIQITKFDYVDRDVEFAFAGALVDKLPQIKPLPAVNEQETNRVILAVISKDSTYLCVKGTT